MQVAESTKRLPDEEPVYRCHSCHKIVLLKVLKEEGRCPLCGGRRVEAISSLTGAEVRRIRKWGVDESFLQTFQNAPSIFTQLWAYAKEMF